MTTSWRLTAGTSTLARLNDRLMKYYRARVKQTADAQDLVGQTWLAAGRGFEGRARLSHYMFAIARRLVADYWRTRGRRMPLTDAADEIPADGPALDEWLITRQNHEIVRGALEHVPDSYRETVRLWLDGYNNFEIALEMGAEYHTVRSRLSRGKAALAAALTRTPE